MENSLSDIILYIYDQVVAALKADSPDYQESVKDLVNTAEYQETILKDQDKQGIIYLYSRQLWTGH